uniref:Peroxidase n=2 Tax=Picea abies TaxID=3329 RepID=Q9SC55_PICAB|nr:SPI2 protein [Picea abies]
MARASGLRLQFRSVLIAGMALMIWIQALHAQSSNGLSPHYYHKSCPEALSIIKSGIEDAVKKEARIAASLLRLHFHDCFVKGCDASVLLDDTANFTGEKTAAPNKNSVRGFGVVDKIKSELEKKCPGVVSCADLLAVAARDSVVISGGPVWDVPLGRRDSRSASKNRATTNIPAPPQPIRHWKPNSNSKGSNSLGPGLVLSGGHSIGLSRCTSFKARLYNQTGNGKPDPTLDTTYLKQLRIVCPQNGTDDNQTVPLDPVTPFKFDVNYYKNIVASKGLLNSDEILYSTNGSKTAAYVKFYTTHTQAFFQQFAVSMIKMSNLSPLTGTRGEIRKNCRKMN